MAAPQHGSIEEPSTEDSEYEDVQSRDVAAGTADYSTMSETQRSQYRNDLEELHG